MNLTGRHPTRWWGWRMTEDGKKGKKNHFIDKFGKQQKLVEEVGMLLVCVSSI